MSFWRSVVTVLSGSAVAQAIPLLGSLIIARLYAPDAFGTFASWLGASTLLAVVQTGRYEMALAQESDGEPRRIAVAAVILTTMCSGFSLLLLFSLAWSLGWARMAHVELWMAVPVAGLLMALAQTWQMWAAAEGDYGILSKMRVVQAVCVTGLQLIFGINDSSAAGLVIAHCLGVACGLFAAFRMLPLRLQYSLTQSRRSAYRSFYIRNRRLPLLSLPSDTVNAASSQLPLLIVTSRYGAEIGGYLALTMRILGGPISLLGAAVLDVFKRHAARSYDMRGECSEEYMRTLKVLAVASTLFVAVMFAFGERFFYVAFGALWAQSGTIAIWMLPMFALRFVASPLSYMFYIAQKQHMDLVWQLTLFVLTVACLFLPDSYATALQAYSAGYCVMYIVYLLMSYRFSFGVRG